MQRTPDHKYLFCDQQEECRKPPPPIVTHFTNAEDGVCPFCPVDECGHIRNLTCNNLTSNTLENSNNTKQAVNTSEIATQLQATFKATQAENTEMNTSNAAFRQNVQNFQTRTATLPPRKGSIRYGSNYLKTLHFPLHDRKVRKKFTKIDTENSQQQPFTSPYKRVKWSSFSPSSAAAEATTASENGDCEKKFESDSNFLLLPIQQHSSSSHGLKRKRPDETAPTKSRIPLKILNTTATLSSRSAQRRENVYV